MEGTIAIVLIIVIIIVFILLKVLTGGSDQNYKLMEKKKLELKGEDTIITATYTVGLPGITEQKIGTFAVVTENYFVFFNYLGTELGKIERDSINKIEYADKSSIEKRVTVTRLLTIGIFALGAKKKKKHNEYCVLIDWEDEKGMQQNTIFTFTSVVAQNQASRAADKFKQYAKTKKTRIAADEKKCPFCAEIIKAEAIVCKHCGRELEKV